MGFLPLGRLSVRLADEKERNVYIQPFNLKNRKLFEDLYLEPFWVELDNFWNESFIYLKNKKIKKILINIHGLIIHKTYK